MEKAKVQKKVELITSVDLRSIRIAKFWTEASIFLFIIQHFLLINSG